MSPSPTNSIQPGKPARRAFTLLELLVVFTIIAILIAVVLMVGQKILAGSKVRATQNVMQTLDQAMEAFVQAKGGTAGKFPDRFVDASGNEFPLADATPAIGNPPFPSGELAVELLKGEPASAAIIQRIPAEFVELVPASAVINGQTPSKRTTAGTAPITYTRIKDAWGRPIRFVHPSYQGIYGIGGNPARTIALRQGGNLMTFSITRDWQVVSAGGDPTFQGTGDGGLCAGGRPYFYSPGSDANAATVADNVYSVRPTFDTQVKANGQ